MCTYYAIMRILLCITLLLCIIIFIYDLLLSYLSRYCVTYVDDVSLIAYSNSAGTAVEQLRQLFDIANLWFTLNHLYINPTKCAWMLTNPCIKKSQSYSAFY